MTPTSWCQDSCGWAIPDACWKPPPSAKSRFNTSPALLAELSVTLSTPKLARPIVRSGLTLGDLLESYLDVAIVVQPLAVRRVVPDDADDDEVLACALAANADLIVSGDRHLLDLGTEYHGIRIVTRSQAVQLIDRQVDGGGVTTDV